MNDGEYQQCQGCELKYYRVIADFFENEEASTSFFRSHGIFPSSVTCPKCRKQCTLHVILRRWQCHSSYQVPKKRRGTRKRCGYMRSDSKGSFLYKSKLKVWQVLCFVNEWVQNKWCGRTALENLDLSSHSLVDLRALCSEVALSWLEHQEPIGGPGIEVEIDKTLIVQKEYNGGEAVEDIWLFGGIARQSKQFFVVFLEGGDQDVSPLSPLIHKFICQGSIVYSDNTAEYRDLNLSEEGYAHNVENNEEDLKVEQRNVPTQSIKLFWRSVKESFKGPGTQARYVRQYIVRYLFARSTGRRALHEFLIEAAGRSSHSGSV